jgi:hypothetical protein
MSYRLYFSCLLFLIFICFPAITHAGGDIKTENKWQAKQVLWWKNDKLIKDVVVSAIALRTANPDSSMIPYL